MKLVWLILFFGEISLAGLRVKSCDYDIKTVRHGSVESAGFYENALEVHRVGSAGASASALAAFGAGRASGPQLFAATTRFDNEGLRLTVRARIENSKLILESKLTSGDFVVAKIKGSSSPLKAGTFVQTVKLPKASEDSTELQIERMVIRCRIGNETIGDRAFDIVEAGR